MAGDVPLLDFSGLGDLANIYREARDKSQRRQTLANLGEKIGAGGDLDYRSIASELIKSGDLPTGLAMLKQGDELAASQDFARQFGGGASPQTPQGTNLTSGAAPVRPAAPLPGPPASINGNGMPIQPQGGAPSVTPRPPIQPTSRVWGDQEAEDAGLYEPRARVAQASSPQGSGELSLANLASQYPHPMPRARPQEAPQAPAGRADQFSGMAPAPAEAPGAPVPQTTPRAVPMPQSSITTNPAAGNVGALVAASTNPRLPAGSRELAKAMLTKALDDAKTPDEVKRYGFYAQQEMQSGRQPQSYNDWELNLKRAGALAITNDMRGENAESQAMGKSAGERAGAMYSAASAAPKTLATLARVNVLLQNVQQGKIEPARMTVSAWAKSLGLDDASAEKLGLDPKSVGNAQALGALTNEAVIGKIGAGGFPANNFSDADRSFLTDTVPKLGNDPAANRIMIEVARRVAQTDIAKAKEFNDWRRSPAHKGQSFADFEVDYATRAAQRDTFGDLAKEAQAIVGGAQGAPGASPQRAPAPQRTAPPPMPGARQAPDGNFYVEDPNRPGKFLKVNP